MDKPIIIRNRPLEHYILSVLSLVAQNEKTIILQGNGSLVSKTLDIGNIITENMLPDCFDKEVKHSIENSSSEINRSLKMSSVKIILKQK